MRRWILGALGVVLASTGALAPVGLAEGDEPLRLRFFDVGAIVSGRPAFIAEQPPLPPDSKPDAYLFGGEGEEGLLPLGTIDEVTEQVMTDLAYMPDWDEIPEPALISAGDLLVLRSRKHLAEAVAARLAAYERAVLRTTTTEVRCVPVTPDADQTQREAPPAVGGGPSLVLTAFPGQRAAGFSGAQRAYLARYEGATAGQAPTDPVVEVANVGLALSVHTAHTATTGRFLVELRGSLVLDPSEFRTVSLRGDRVIEVPDWSVTHIRATTIVEEGVWSRLDAASIDSETGSRWTFWVRVFGNPYVATAGPLPLAAFEAEPDGTSGGYTNSWIDASATSRFGARCFFRPTLPPHLFVSQLPDPGWGEVGCSMELFSAECLVALLRDSFPPGTWEHPDRRLEARNAFVKIGGPAPLVEAAEARARELLTQQTWALATRASIVEVPDDLALGLMEGAVGRNGAPLLRREGAAILARAERDGRARTVDEITLTAVGCSGTAAQSGRRVTYVADHDIVVGEKGTQAIAVEAEAFGGFALDVRPSMTGGRAAAYLDIRAFRSNVPAQLRTLQTPHGPVELPRMDVLRVRTALVVPFGETAIAGAGGQNGRTRLLLITPRLLTP